MREELIRIVADRTDLSPSLVSGWLAAGAPPAPARSSAPGSAGAPAAPGPPRALALDAAARSERDFLAQCLALPGRRPRGARRDRRRDGVHVEPRAPRGRCTCATTSTRRATSLPEGDEELAALIAELAVRARARTRRPARPWRPRPSSSSSPTSTASSPPPARRAPATWPSSPAAARSSSARSTPRSTGPWRSPCPSATRTSVRIMDKESGSRTSWRQAGRSSRSPGRPASTRAPSRTGSGSTGWSRCTREKHRPRGGLIAGAVGAACRSGPARSVRSLSELGVSTGIGTALAGEVRTADGQGRPTEARIECHGVPTRWRRHVGLPAPRLDHGFAPAATRVDGGVSSAGWTTWMAVAGTDEGTAGDRGRRLVPALRLRPFLARRCSSITSTRPRRSSTCRRPASGARSQPRARRLPEVRPALCQLPCGGRGRSSLPSPAPVRWLPSGVAHWFGPG